MFQCFCAESDYINFFRLTRLPVAIVSPISDCWSVAFGNMFATLITLSECECVCRIDLIKHLFVNCLLLITSLTTFTSPASRRGNEKCFSRLGKVSGSQAESKCHARSCSNWVAIPEGVGSLGKYYAVCVVWSVGGLPAGQSNPKQGL